MEFTKERLPELIYKHTDAENLMVSERREYLRDESLSGNKCNGFRPGRTYGHGQEVIPEAGAQNRF